MFQTWGPPIKTVEQNGILLETKANNERSDIGIRKDDAQEQYRHEEIDLVGTEMTWNNGNSYTSDTLPVVSS
ncbi:hypothetical protein AHAS_Ahas14G0080500 [Arachis hypogaea]